MKHITGIELFGLLKYLNEDIEEEELQSEEDITLKPSLYINIYFNQDINNEGEIDMKVLWDNYKIDEENGVINIYDGDMKLKYIIPFK